jgi:HEAT repeat protein
MVYGFAMGLKDMLFGGPDARRKKHATRARNKDAQSADRFASLQALAEDGTSEAVAGLLGRFTMRCEKSIEDEQEKEYVHDQLVRMGARILPELQAHLRSADSIAWGLKVLGDLHDDAAAWPILADLCERNDNTYTRDPSKKVQLLLFLGEFGDPRAAQALVPYLEDIDEGVRFHAVEGLLRHRNPEVAREPLLTLLVNPKEESRRIKKRIIEGLADLGWEVKGFTGTVEKMLSDLLPGSRVDNQGRIKKRG